MSIKSRFDPKVACAVAKKMSLVDPFSKTGAFIKDEDGNTIDFDVVGVLSKDGVNAKAKYLREMNKKPSEEKEAEIGAEWAAGVTKGWSANISFVLDGQKLEFSEASAKELFMSQEWIGMQVLKFAYDQTNYDPNA